MDWIICADDWGAHVSTTQHIASEIARSDRVLWINSIGMRAPALSARDVRRVWQKFRMLRGGTAPTRHSLVPAPLAIVHPRLLPWHLNPAANAVSHMLFGRQMKRILGQLDFKNEVVLTANPMLVRHLDFPCRHLLYLRLDDYERLPGVDPRMVRICEDEIYDQAEIIFYTARRLAPAAERILAKSYFLPQAIDVGHFDSVSLKPPRTKILGFFGLLAEWLDDQLIEQVARACPDWTLEFIGPKQYFPERLERISNIRVVAAVPYNELPAQVGRWDAAWAPFRITELTLQVNPLKLREYLAAGLPALCTPLPEARDLGPRIVLMSRAEDVKRELANVAQTDSEELRRRRRDSVRGDSWASRAAQVRAMVQALDGSA